MPAKSEPTAKVVEEAKHLVEVSLVDARDGFHTIFHSNGAIHFENGVANVLEDVAKELRALGQVK